MAWTEIEHTCGHTSRVQLYGKAADRRWRAERMATYPCADCQAAQRAAESAAAAEQAQTAGLPGLSGSAAQVQWAETIRRDKLGHLARARAGELSPIEFSGYFGSKCELTDPGIDLAVDALLAQDRASWWIDRRDRPVSTLLVDALAGHQAAAPTRADAAIAAAALAEATIRPEVERTPIVCEIAVAAPKITLRFPAKREDFRVAVKAIGYTWDGSAWVRIISQRAGTIEDRAAEAANRILALGIPVRCHDEAVRAKAISADFAPEQKRWITAYTSGPNLGKLCITWPHSEDLYRHAKRLPGARYAKPSVAVPPGAWEAIEDFAAAHGFSISDAARAVLDAHRQAHAAALVAKPAAAPKQPKAPGAMPAPTGEIAPSLRDEP